MVFMDSDERVALKVAPMFVILIFLRSYMYTEIVLKFYYLLTYLLHGAESFLRS